MNQEIKNKLIKVGYKGGFGLSELIEACLLYKEYRYWFESSNNPISNKWSARLAKFPSSNNQHNDGSNEIYLEIGDSPEEAVANLYISINKK